MVEGVLGEGLRGSARAHVPVCEDPADVAEPSGIEGDDGAGPRHVKLAGLAAEEDVAHEAVAERGNLGRIAA